MWRKTIGSMFIKMSILPFCMVTVLMLMFHGIKSINAINQAQAEQAKRIAEMMAVVASERPLPIELMTSQVNTLLSNSETLASVNFYPLDQQLPEQSQRTQMFDDYLSRNAAVMINNDDGSSNLMGYINVTMDLEKARQPVIRSLLTEFVVAAALLLALLFLLIYTFTSSSGAIRRLSAVSQQVIDGNHHISMIDHQRSRSVEMRLFEDALINLSTKIQLMEQELHATQEVNTILTRREQSLSHRQLTFQSLVTHELRTPLNAISGGLQLLETQRLDVASMDSLNLIRKGHHRLSSLLDNIIELNSLQQGSVSITEQRFSPEELLRSLAETYSQACLQKGIQLAVDIKHTDVNMLGDKEKITQLLSYIVDNAVKFTPSGTVTLVSRVVHSSQDSIQWQCDVVDTGVGIEKRLQQDIFKAYVQADSSHSREFEGSGLGLTLAKKLAELMSGELTLTSEVGKGSCFRLSLNMRDSSQLASHVSLDGISVVHVHNGQSAEFAQSLREMGASAFEFTDIKRAETAVINEQVDLVTICAQMTPEQACQFATNVREQEFTHRSVIVYFVPEAHRLDELWLSSAGIDYWLPFTSLDVVAKQLVTWLEN